MLSQRLPSPPPPILRLLGGALIDSDGVPIGGAGAHRHRLALLALLAVTRRPVSRDKLMAYLWPERDTDSARTLLRTALYEIRKLLGESAIRRTGDAVSIDPSMLRCDVIEFETAVADDDFERAVALYAGPFLDGFFITDASEFEHWVDEERARLERLRDRARARLHEEPPRAVPLAAGIAALEATRDAAPSESSTTPARISRVDARYTRLTIAITAVLALIAIAVIGARWSRGSDSPPPSRLSRHADVATGSALAFDGSTATVSTEPGTVVTPRTEEISVDLIVKYDGPSAKDQMLFYNGDSRVSGWGIMVLGAEQKQPDGTIAVLAGGVNLMATPLVLARGAWQRLAVERRNGQFTLTLDDSTFVLGALPVNPIGGAYKAHEHTSVGGEGFYDQARASFHGAIDRVRIRDLAGAHWIERWFFDEANGPITTGAQGTVLRVGQSKWIDGPRLSTPDVFWSRLESLCGQAFGGQVNDSAAVAHLVGCQPNAIQLAMHVGGDRSRTLLLTRLGPTLELRAERHRGNGSEDENGRWLGIASNEGSFERQEFAGAKRADVGRVVLVPDTSLTYEREVDGARRVRMTFDLTRQVATPPAPWGASGAPGVHTSNETLHP
jgi:hypothetical protein